MFFFHSSSNPKCFVTRLFTMNTALVDVWITSMISASRKFAIRSVPLNRLPNYPTLYIQDESAFIPEGEAALNAVIPTGARFICISTASAGWFGDACSM